MGLAASSPTVGRHGVITPEEARRRAALIIARIKAGEDPVPEPLAAKRPDEPTVAGLAARYLKEYAEEHCKPNTVRAYAGRGAVREGEAFKSRQPEKSPERDAGMERTPKGVDRDLGL